MATDNKDWSVYAAHRCGQCGLDASAPGRAEVVPMTLDTVSRWAMLLREGSINDLRVRPAPHVWSTLEYGAHVRDMIRLFTDRIARILVADSPAFPAWDQEAAAIAARYNEQEPAIVAEEASADADRLARIVGGMDTGGWERSGTRDGREFTVEYLLRYLLHDIAHHWHDVTEPRFADRTSAGLV
ncbi:DinB family protein [Gordonia defluvii]|uniref:DinB family protein n=1 Tax=Gordonia defluvii TaxID=283718 RepID=UPI0031D5E976